MNKTKKIQLLKLLKEYKGNLLKQNQTIQYNDVNKEAKRLGLKLQRKSDSYGYSVIIADTKSKASTKGVLPRSPETQDFLNRLKDLKNFIKGRQVQYQGQKVTGFK